MACDIFGSSVGTVTYARRATRSVSIASARSQSVSSAAAHTPQTSVGNVESSAAVKASPRACKRLAAQITQQLEKASQSLASKFSAGHLSARHSFHVPTDVNGEALCEALRNTDMALGDCVFHLDFDGDTDMLVVRLMVGVPHETACGQFSHFMAVALAQAFPDGQMKEWLHFTGCGRAYASCRLRI